MLVMEIINYEDGEIIDQVEGKATKEHFIEFIKKSCNYL